jgi:UDPglucose--hexose-1-phosphate uridylyltransferase
MRSRQGEGLAVSAPQRPRQGEVGQKASPSSVSYDSECYLCPGNKRAGGAVNPPYASVFSSINDYSALLPVCGNATRS